MATRLPNKAYLTKDPTGVHEGFAEFIAKTTGHTVPVGDVALVQRLYPLYLKSPQVVKAREAEKAAREKAEQEKAERKRQRAQARLEALEEQRQRLLAELGIDAEQESKPAPVLPFPKPVAVPEPEPEDDDTEEGPVEVVLSNDSFEEPEQDPEADDDLWGDDEDEEDF